MKNFYITTTLPYVNSKPHMGHALEFIEADIIARYRRLMGDNVVFNTGTDEHGQKIYEKAVSEGKDAQAYVDEYAAKFKKLKEILNLSSTNFIRTTDPHHKEAAQEMWRRCFKKGDIYKKKYKGLYCVGDEMFLRPSDLVGGKCPNHPNMEPVQIEEENYFFKLSAYQDKILTYLGSNAVIPDWRREEAVNFVKAGLEDFSISREKSRLSWGVPVPDDENQVMYVWFDALTNYISTLGWPEDQKGDFKKFWVDGTAIQIAGKDQVRFQSIMWQGMLMSAGVKNTDKIFYHGFITSGGQKMSKSLGNVVDPLEIVEKYGTDVLRYWCAKEANMYEDSDFTWEKFKESYNADLANGLGNLVSRIMKLANLYLAEPVVPPENTIPDEFKLLMENFELKKASEFVWGEIASLDRYIQETQPFSLVKTEKEKAVEIIKELALRLYTIARLLNPILPATSQTIKGLVKENKVPDKPLFPRAL